MRKEIQMEVDILELKNTISKLKIYQMGWFIIELDTVQEKGTNSKTSKKTMQTEVGRETGLGKKRTDP